MKDGSVTKVYFTPTALVFVNEKHGINVSAKMS